MCVCSKQQWWKLNECIEGSKSASVPISSSSSFPFLSPFLLLSSLEPDTNYRRRLRSNLRFPGFPDTYNPNQACSRSGHNIISGAIHPTNSPIHTHNQSTQDKRSGRETRHNRIDYGLPQHA